MVSYEAENAESAAVSRSLAIKLRKGVLVMVVELLFDTEIVYMTTLPYSSTTYVVVSFLKE